MVLLNCYHAYPLRQIPGWLKTMQACISCGMKRAHRSRANEVLPSPSDNRQFQKHDLKTGDQDINSTPIEAGDSPNLGKKIITPSKIVMTEIRTEEEEENLRLEWKKLVGHFDRLLFIIFTTIHLFTFLFIFCVVPDMHAWKSVSHVSGACCYGWVMSTV